MRMVRSTIGGVMPADGIRPRESVPIMGGHLVGPGHGSQSIRRTRLRRRIAPGGNRAKTLLKSSGGVRAPSRTRRTGNGIDPGGRTLRIHHRLSGIGALKSVRSKTARSTTRIRRKVSAIVDTIRSSCHPARSTQLRGRQRSRARTRRRDRRCGVRNKMAESPSRIIRPGVPVEHALAHTHCESRRIPVRAAHDFGGIGILVRILRRELIGTQVPAQNPRTVEHRTELKARDQTPQIDDGLPRALEDSTDEFQTARHPIAHTRSPRAPRTHLGSHPRRLLIQLLDNRGKSRTRLVTQRLPRICERSRRQTGQLHLSDAGPQPRVLRIQFTGQLRFVGDARPARRLLPLLIQCLTARSAHPGEGNGIRPRGQSSTRTRETACGLTPALRLAFETRTEPIGRPTAPPISRNRGHRIGELRELARTGLHHRRARANLGRIPLNHE